MTLQSIPRSSVTHSLMQNLDLPSDIEAKVQTVRGDEKCEVTLYDCTSKNVQLVKKDNSYLNITVSGAVVRDPLFHSQDFKISMVGQKVIVVANEPLRLAYAEEREEPLIRTFDIFTIKLEKTQNSSIANLIDTSSPIDEVIAEERLK